LPNFSYRAATFDGTKVTVAKDLTMKVPER
jgi:hypothetical protein